MNAQCGVHVAPCSNPPDQRRLLDLGQRQMRVGHRHHHGRVRAQDAADELALAGVAGHHRPMAGGQRGKRALFRVEAQAALARAVVRAMALEALVRQDRPHVEVEVHLRRHAGHLRRGRTARGSADRGDGQGLRRPPRATRRGLARDSGTGLEGHAGNHSRNRSSLSHAPVGAMRRLSWGRGDGYNPLHVRRMTNRRQDRRGR